MGVVVQVCGPGLPLPLARRDAWCNALEIDKATVLERDDLRLNLSLAPELVKQVELDLPRTPLLTAHGLHGSRQARLVAQVAHEEEDFLAGQTSTCLPACSRRP